MSITLTIDPSATPLSLHDRANGWRLVEFDPGNPDPETQWASSADTEGALVASSRPLNRTITARVIIEKSTAALLQTAENTLGMKVGKLMREQGTLQLGYPSADTITFDVLEARAKRSITPQFMYRNLAEYELQFVCKPYGYGTEVDLGDNTETTLPCLIFMEASVAGDVPALGRLVIDDDSAADQAWVAWGVETESKYTFTDSTGSGALFYEAESRTPLGNAAVATGPSGASGGGSNNTIGDLSLATLYQPVLSTQASGGGSHLSHIGQFRVFARVQVPSANTGAVSLALQWGQGDFRRTTTNTAVEFDADDLLEGKWTLADLGQVILTRPVTGTQRWEGRIIAKSTVAGDDIYIDYLLLIPCGTASGEARGVMNLESATTYAARDEFDQAAGALTGKTAPVGGIWAGAGDADDFQVETTGKTVQRTAVSDASGHQNGRLVTVGSSLTAVVAQVDLKATGNGNIGLLLRYADTSNFWYVWAQTNGAGGSSIGVNQRVAGSGSIISQPQAPTLPMTSYNTLRVAIFATGLWMVWWVEQGADFDTPIAMGTTSVLATGGALASGKVGLIDWYSDASPASTRTADNFQAFVPTIDAAMFASQSLEIRHDRVQREDSAGAIWTPVTSYVGDYLTVPPSGAEARELRCVVKGSRYDPATTGDPNIDDISARLFVTPRYLVVPE